MGGRFLFPFNWYHDILFFFVLFSKPYVFRYRIFFPMHFYFIFVTCLLSFLSRYISLFVKRSLCCIFLSSLINDTYSAFTHFLSVFLSAFLLFAFVLLYSLTLLLFYFFSQSSALIHSLSLISAAILQEAASCAANVCSFFFHLLCKRRSSTNMTRRRLGHINAVQICIHQ